MLAWVTFLLDWWKYFFSFLYVNLDCVQLSANNYPEDVLKWNPSTKNLGNNFPYISALGRFIIHISISKPLSPSMVEKKILFNSFNNISQMLLKMNNIWLNMNNRWLKKPEKQMFQRALFSVTCCLFMWIHNVFLFEHLLRLQRLQLSVSEPRLRFLDLKWS